MILIQEGACPRKGCLKINSFVAISKGQKNCSCGCYSSSLALAVMQAGSETADPVGEIRESGYRPIGYLP